MPSNFNHIDEFIRNKEKESETDLSRQEMHWNQMQQMLAGTPAVKGKLISGKFLLSIAAGIMVIGFLGVLLYQRTDRSTTDLNPVIIVETSKPVTPALESSPTLPQAPVIAEPIEETKKAVVRTQTTSVRSIIDSTPSLFLHSPIQKEEQNIVREERDNAGMTIASFFASLEKPAQEYLINPERDTTIVCAEGTSIHIPASSFTRKNGGTVEGIISFRVKEYYEIADIIANKLTTSSNGQLLETGGMLYLEAAQGTEELQLDETKALQVQMPTNRFDPNMQLFYGEETEATTNRGPSGYFSQDVVNWQPAGQRQSYFDFRNRTIEVWDMANDPREVIIRKGKKIAKFIVPNYGEKDLTSWREALILRHGNLYDEIRVRYGWRETRNPKNSPWPAGTPSIDGLVGSTVRLTLEDARKLNLISAEDSARRIAQWIKEYEGSDSLQREYLQFRYEYSFNLNKLGWINCDKLLGNIKGRTRLLAKINDQFQDQFIQSFLVFRNLNSVAAGTYREGNLVFENVPVGRPVALICVGVKDGKAYMCVKETRISPSTLTGLQFEETTPEKFRENMLRFGNVKG